MIKLKKKYSIYTTTIKCGINQSGFLRLFTLFKYNFFTCIVVLSFAFPRLFFNKRIINYQLLTVVGVNSSVKLITKFIHKRRIFLKAPAIYKINNIQY